MQILNGANMIRYSEARDCRTLIKLSDGKSAARTAICDYESAGEAVKLVIFVRHFPLCCGLASDKHSLVIVVLPSNFQQITSFSVKSTCEMVL